MKYSLPVILLGPMATGKSTVGAEIAKATGIARIPMDRVRWYYYFQNGFSQEKESSLDLFVERMSYWKPFEVEAIRNILIDFPNSIIDFGAGHSHFPDEEQFKIVLSLMNPVKNIFLLLPNEDKNESLRICNERLRFREGNALDETKLEANREFINHPSSFLLSKHQIYTKNETPDKTAKRIIGLLK